MQAAQIMQAKIVQTEKIIKKDMIVNIQKSFQFFVSSIIEIGSG